MAPSFEAVLQMSPALITAGAGTPEARADNFLELVLEQIRMVDWASSGLPPRRLRRMTNVVTLDPPQAAEAFAEAAVEDARILMSACQWACEDYGMAELPQDEAAFGGRLRNSRAAMLEAAGLPDNDRTALFWAIGDTGQAYHLIGRHLLQPPIRPTACKQSPGFAWSGELAAWIHRQKRSDRGCPARQIRSSSEAGDPLPLTHVFWDRLVQVMYLTDAA